MPSYDPKWGGIPTRRAGGGLPSSDTPEAKTAPVELHNAFYSDIPFDRINYFAREEWIDWPMATPADLHVTTVGKGLVLLVTSVMYRALTFVRTGIQMDSFLLANGALAGCTYFGLSIGTGAPYDMSVVGGPVLPPVSGGTSYATTLLNEDVLIPEIKFVLPVNEGQTIRATMNVTGPNHPTLPPDKVGVQIKGMWMTRGDYNSWQRRLAR
jgi:hypothetical protein